jgi:hypothetical protein
MARNKPSSRQNAIFYSILTKTKRYCVPVGDISTFKGSFHSISHAKRSATRVLSRSNYNSWQNAILSSILKKTKRYFVPVVDISTFKRLFHSISHAKRSASRFMARNKPSSRQNAIFSSIFTKIKRYFVPVGDISTFKRSFHSISHAERSAGLFPVRYKPSS